MSKSEEKTATGDAKNQNLQYNQNAQSSYTQAQGDIGDYAGQLAKYAASNPYVAGGAYQTAGTQEAADTAASGAQSASQAAQAAAVRSGGNPAAAIAAGEQVSENNARNLTNEEAQQTQQRLGLMAGYNGDVLKASAVPEQMEQGLLSTEAGAGNSALGQEVDAAKTPSYLDQLVSGGIAAGDAFAGGYGKSVCWVAAKMWGGWDDTRVIILRLWLACVLSRKWYGRKLCALYARYGEQLAYEWMDRNPWIDGATRQLFRFLYRRAAEWNRRTKSNLLIEYIKLEQEHREIRKRDPKAFSDWAIGHLGRSF